MRSRRRLGIGIVSSGRLLGVRVIVDGGVDILGRSRVGSGARFLVVTSKSRRVGLKSGLRVRVNRVFAVGWLRGISSLGRAISVVALLSARDSGLGVGRRLTSTIGGRGSVLAGRARSGSLDRCGRGGGLALGARS